MMSVAVLVLPQKYRGNSVQPIGSTRGSVRRGLSPHSCGIATANCYCQLRDVIRAHHNVIKAIHYPP
jgi:hypothetical protein